MADIFSIGNEFLNEFTLLVGSLQTETISWFAEVEFEHATQDDVEFVHVFRATEIPTFLYSYFLWVVLNQLLSPKFTDFSESRESSQKFGVIVLLAFVELFEGIFEVGVGKVQHDGVFGASSHFIMEQILMATCKCCLVHGESGTNQTSTESFFSLTFLDKLLKRFQFLFNELNRHLTNVRPFSAIDDISAFPSHVLLQNPRTVRGIIGYFSLHIVLSVKSR